MRWAVIVLLFASTARAQEDPSDVALDRQVNECNDGAAAACVVAAETYRLAEGCVGQSVHAFARACKLGDKAHCKKAMLTLFRKELADAKSEHFERVEAGVGYLPDKQRNWTQLQALKEDRAKRVEHLEALIEETTRPGSYERNEAMCRAQLAAFRMPEPPPISTQRALELIRQHNPDKDKQSLSVTK